MERLPVERTSQTDPIRIAELRADGVRGRIGVTFCPGKIDPHSAEGAWRRDPHADLDAIRQWGASAVVTLIEDHEFDLLKVRDLGREVTRRHIEWLHLPIPDVSVPRSDFEAGWKLAGEGLRARLRSGFDVVVHCRGGLGRAGTIAARLLIELGMEPAQAVDEVRRARKHAIETHEQKRYVLRQGCVPELQPDTSIEAIRDRALGAMLGLAVGDALGTTLEFSRRDSHEPLTGIVGGGPFRLKPGEWTDDTAMSLALAESLVACGRLDEADLLARFYDWYRNGTYSCTGTCFDIGVTTRQALDRWKATGAAHAGSTAPDTAGNGSLMRLAPIAVRYWRDRAALKDAAARQSRTTHGAAEAVDACVAYAEMLADAIAGAPRSVVLGNRDGGYAGAIAQIAKGSWQGRARNTIRASGYVAHSLEAALWSAGRTGDFRGAVLAAANLGEDADTTAAITGQLAGALYGASGIPEDFLCRLAWRDRITQAAAALFEVAS